MTVEVMDTNSSKQRCNRSTNIVLSTINFEKVFGPFVWDVQEGKRYTLKVYSLAILSQRWPPVIHSNDC